MPDTAIWAEQLKILIDLQKVDARIYGFERDLGAIPRERKGLEASFEARKAELKKSEQALKELQLLQKSRENDLLTKETNVKKYQSQQSQVKTNKEYSALTHEINGLKADCAVFEDEILKLMDQIENHKKTVENDRKKTADEERDFKSRIAELDAKTKDLEGQIAKLKEERGAYLPRANRELLGQYEKILKKREGSALAELTKESCGGCHMTIRPQNLNEVRLREKMINCETCGRILYDAASS